MKTSSRRWAGAFLLAVILSVSGPLAAQDMVLYDDVLLNSWEDWSWGAHDFACTNPVHSGSYSISLVPSGWAAIYLHRPAAVSGADYVSLDFYIHGGASGGQNLRLVFLLGGTSLVNRPLTDFLPGGPVAGTWSEVQVSLASIGLGASAFNEL